MKLEGIKTDGKGLIKLLEFLHSDENAVTINLDKKYISPVYLLKYIEAMAQFGSLKGQYTITIQRVTSTNYDKKLAKVLKKIVRK